MKDMVLAELRRSWKGKRMFAAFLAFLCFFLVVYILCMYKEKRYEDDLIMSMHEQNIVTGSKCAELTQTLQMTPTQEEQPNQRLEATCWCDVYEQVYSWSMLRQAPSYYDWQSINAYAIGRARSFLKLVRQDFYQNEMDMYGIQEASLMRDHTYYSYFSIHNIQPYTTPYEPTLLNFYMQLFQHDTMLLLIIIVCLFMADQICHDFDSGAYKTIYSLPITRTRLVMAKITAAMVTILIAFLCALALFSIAPLLLHGVGSASYPYIIHRYDVVSWSWLIVRAAGFSLLVILFYMVVAASIAFWQKSMSNTLLCVGSMLLLVYFLTRVFGYTTVLFSWIPLFYLYPVEITAHDFALSLSACSIVCIAWILLVIFFHVRRIKTTDLEGGMR